MNRKDNTAGWIAAALLLAAIFATQADPPVDLNNDRCFESIGGTEQC